MKQSMITVAVMLAATPAFGQDWPKMTPEGQAAVLKLGKECARIGAMGNQPRPDGKGMRLVLLDAEKARAAVKSLPDLPLKDLCDALVVGWTGSDALQKPFYLDLLTAVGHATEENRTQAFANYLRGKELADARNLKEAIVPFLEAAEQFKAAKELGWQASALTSAGIAGGELGEGRKALEHLIQAHEIFRGLFPRDHKTLATALCNVGAAYHAVSEYENALKYHTLGVEMQQRLDPRDHESIARSFYNIGMVHHEMGDYEKAVKRHNEAIGVYRRLANQDTSLALALSALGADYDMLGDYGKALQLKKEALGLVQRFVTGDSQETAVVLSRIGISYGKLGEFERAIEYHTRALSMDRRLFPGDHQHLVADLGNLGNVHNNFGQYDQALQYHRAALEMKRRLTPDGDLDTSQSLMNLGMSLRNVHRNREALTYYDQSLTISRRLFAGDHPHIPSVLSNAGIAHRDLGEFEKALDRHTEALAMKRRMCQGDHPDLAIHLINLGAVQKDLGDARQSLALYQDAVRMLRAPGVDSRASEPISANQLRPSPRTLLALTGLSAARRALLPPSPSVDELRDCERDLAAAAEVQDRLRDEVLSRDLSKLRSGEVTIEIVPLRIGLLQQLHRLDRKEEHLHAAFTAAEQGRARVLLEALAQRRAGRLAEAPAELGEREEQLFRTIRTIAARIDRLETSVIAKGDANLEGLWKQRDAAENELKKVVERLRAAAPRYADLRYPRPCSIDEARAALQPGEIALLFVLGLDASYIVLLEKEPARDDPDGGLAIVKLPPRERIETQLASLLDTQNTLKSTTLAKDAGASLFDLLLGPVAPRLAGKSLVIVPDGLLCYLPFQLLVDRQDRFLIETHRIRYAPSLTTLHLTRLWAEDRIRRQTLPDRQAFALGDPDYRPGLGGLLAQAAGLRFPGVRGESFARLTHSGNEVRAVAALLGAERCRVLVEEQATEAAVKAASRSGELGRYRYLHFACHGVLGQGPGQPPGLVLANRGVDGRDDDLGVNDGYLRADEVVNLRLNADLAVLSACKSGRGRLYAGEGVEGLARSFMYAGSRGVVCSLWSVDDAATAELMVGMYQRLKRGSPSAEALREAQLEMIAAGKPPVLWAPFILNGE